MKKINLYFGSKLSLSLLLTILLVLNGCSNMAPKPNEHTIVDTIAFGSCSHQDKPQDFWQVITNTEPDLFVHLGDNIYSDTFDIKVLRANYQKLATNEHFKKFRQQIPYYAIWDDHDYGDNDAGAEYAMKVDSQKAFMDFVGEAKNSKRRNSPGVYDSKIFGPKGKRIQLILLDTRYFRSSLKKDPRPKRRYMPDYDKSKTILGETQWQWLEQQLKKPADLRIIASSIQVNAVDHAWEAWYNFANERKRLYNLIKKTKANGTVVISGDRHKGIISKNPTTAHYPIYEVTASPLTEKLPAKFVPEKDRYRLGKIYGNTNFGLIKINWSENKLSLQLRDVESGKIVRSQEVSMKDLL